MNEDELEKLIKENQSNFGVDPIFNIDPTAYKYWKHKKYICCSSMMQLWVGLQLCSPLNLCNGYTREELLAAIRSFPESTYNCKCHYCRYKRMYDRRTK